MATVQLEVRPGHPAVAIDFYVEIRDDTPGAKYEITFNGVVIDTLTSDRGGNVRKVISASTREVALANFGGASRSRGGFLYKGHQVGLKDDEANSITVVKL